MKIHKDAPILEEILESKRADIGSDFAAYRNHCYRVLNFCIALSEDTKESFEKIQIAVAFHDLGIWTRKTFDYLLPSEELAREYLTKTKRSEWTEEMVGKLIETYEEEHVDIPNADPIEVLKYLMKEHNLTQKDLKILGSQGVVSEILNRKRQLNNRQIKELSKRFKVSPAVFI